MIASPAMIPALMVRPSTESARVTDTRPSTIPAGDTPPPSSSGSRLETAEEAAARAGLVVAGRRSRWWAIPLTVLAFLVLLAVSVAAVVPASAVAEKENQRLRKAVSDLTLDKLILQEASKGNY